jgi:drug/metabolite transporter, DME family
VTGAVPGAGVGPLDGAPLGGAPPDGTSGRSSFALVITGAVLWGTGGVAGAALAGVAGFPPVTVAAARLGVAGLALLLVLAAVGRLTVPRGRGVAGRLVLVGGLAAAYQAAYFAAVDRVSVSVATFVALGAAPVLVAVATAVRRRRRPPRVVLVALVLAVAGLALLTAGSPGSSVGASPGLVVGVLLALGAAAAFAAMTLVNRRPVPGLSPIAMTAGSFTLGGLLLLPWALLGAGAVPDVPVQGWLLVAFLGLVPTAAAYAAYFTGLRGVQATSAALVALLEPVTAAVLAALLLGDRLGPVGLLGGLLLVSATAVVAPRPGRVRHRR